MGLSFLISFLRNIAGWRRAAVAFAVGAVMALSMPPFGIFPLLWLCLPALIFLLQGTQNWKQAFVTGWCFAFGFFVFGLYWIAASMFVDIAQFWWAVPLAVAGLPAYFAIYYGFAAIIARRIGLRGIGGAVAFGLLWFLADYARGHIFTGFPWNLTGYAWSQMLPVLQVTSICGIYGLTLLTAIAACLAAAVPEGGKAPRTACNAGIIMFLIIGIAGEVRLQTTPTVFVPNVRLRLVQPDTDQATKWLMNDRERNFEELLSLSAAPAAQQPTLIIWPETASTFYLTEDAAHRQKIAAILPKGASLITGVIRRDTDGNGDMRYYNSMVALDAAGDIVAGYDKAHLVPFGEFMPLRKWIPLKALAASVGDFRSGPGVQSLSLPNLPLFSPLICYEAIFPGAVVNQAMRPGMMINMTNDGWYGNTTGPYQHFTIVRVRAIEEGLPVVRVANTGISGVFDPAGRTVKRLGLSKQGFIDSDLPAALPATFFARWGEMPMWVVFFLVVAQLAVAFNRKKLF